MLVLVGCLGSWGWGVDDIGGSRFGGNLWNSGSEAKKSGALRNTRKKFMKFQITFVFAKHTKLYMCMEMRTAVRRRAEWLRQASLAIPGPSPTETADLLKTFAKPKLANLKTFAKPKLDSDKI